MNNRVADLRSPPASEAFAPAKRPLMRSSDFDQMVQPLQDWIIKYPGAALASAFLVGVVVAWWIKRK